MLIIIHSRFIQLERCFQSLYLIYYKRKYYTIGKAICSPRDFNVDSREAARSDQESRIFSYKAVNLIYTKNNKIMHTNQLTYFVFQIEGLLYPKAFLTNPNIKKKIL